MPEDYVYIREFVKQRNERVRVLEGFVRDRLANGDVVGASRYADRILCLLGVAIVAMHRSFNESEADVTRLLITEAELRRQLAAVTKEQEQELERVIAFPDKHKPTNRAMPKKEA